MDFGTLNKEYIYRDFRSSSWHN